MFQRLPPDNFPDDTQTAAYQNYREGQAPSRFRLPTIHWRQWRAYIIAGLIAIAISIVLVLLYGTFSDNNVNPTDLPPPPTPTEQSLVMRGDFPVNVSQQFITAPARIEDTLPGGVSRGYTFLAYQGVTWNITLVGSTGFQPRMNLYGPDGSILSRSEAPAAGQNASMSHFVAESGLYAILVEGANNTGGDYTFILLPENLP
ncbi:MAG: hypothetical protein L0154_12560 [Chloroflexi bacterium]|nr:hypothetical protein [Chloroflexota bacterium]